MATSDIISIVCVCAYIRNVLGVLYTLVCYIKSYYKYKKRAVMEAIIDFMC
jgi:hypothetical protein